MQNLFVWKKKTKKKRQIQQKDMAKRQANRCYIHWVLFVLSFDDAPDVVAVVVVFVASFLSLVFSFSFSFSFSFRSFSFCNFIFFFSLQHVLLNHPKHYFQIKLSTLQIWMENNCDDEEHFLFAIFDAYWFLHLLNFLILQFWR